MEFFIENLIVRPTDGVNHGRDLTQRRAEIGFAVAAATDEHQAPPRSSL